MTARFFLALFLAAVFPFPVFADDGKVSLQITVVEEKNGSPLPGVVVGFPDYGIWGVTDENGEAGFKSVPEGRTTVSARLVGMLDIDMECEPKDMVLKMEESTFWLDKVEVVAKANTAGASTSSSISRAAIDHLQATSLSDIMELLPGQLSSNPSLSGVS